MGGEYNAPRQARRRSSAGDAKAPAGDGNLKAVRKGILASARRDLTQTRLHR
jgi:hypothetical protein